MTTALDRRGFLLSAAGVAASATTVGGATVVATSTAANAEPDERDDRGCGQRIPRKGIGMHLYTMRSVLATDYPGTLLRLADIGYRTVGVSGRFGHTSAAIRGFAEDADLRIVLEHVGYDRIANDWAGAVADVRALGGQWIVISSLPSSLRSPDGYRKAAAEFNQAGAVARDAGIKLLYHNHDFDFLVMNGEVLYDILAAETDPDLVGFELDLYWCVKGKKHPSDYFTGHPGRFPALHVKDMAPSGDFADVGSGILNFPAMFAHTRTAGIRQWLVEHDRPADVWVTAQNSYDYLSRLRY